MASASFTVSSCSECCAFVCPDSDTLEIVFSGVELWPTECTPGSAPGTSFIGTSIVLDGLYTLTWNPSLFRWEYDVPSSYFFTTWNTDDCSGESFDEIAAIRVVVLCVSGSGESDGLYIGVTTVNETGPPFNVSGVSLMSNGGDPFQLDEEFTPSGVGQNPINGTIMVTLP